MTRYNMPKCPYPLSSIRAPLPHRRSGPCHASDHAPIFRCQDKESRCRSIHTCCPSSSSILRHSARSHAAGSYKRLRLPALTSSEVCGPWTEASLSSVCQDNASEADGLAGSFPCMTSSEMPYGIAGSGARREAQKNDMCCLLG